MKRVWFYRVAGSLLAGLGLIALGLPDPPPLAQEGYESFGGTQILLFQGTIDPPGGGTFSGIGNFKFVIVDRTGTTALWSHDGSSSDGKEPSTSIPVPVQDNEYFVPLGDSRYAGMASLDSTVFNSGELYLRVWFNNGIDGTFHQQIPDRKLSGAGYAYRSDVSSRADWARTLQGFKPSDFEPSGAVDRHEERFTHLTQEEAEALVEAVRNLRRDGRSLTGLGGAGIETVHGIFEAPPHSVNRTHFVVPDEESRSAELYLYGEPGNGMEEERVPTGVRIWLDGNDITNVLRNPNRKNRSEYGSIPAHLTATGFQGGSFATAQEFTWKAIEKLTRQGVRADGNVSFDWGKEPPEGYGFSPDRAWTLVWEGFLEFATTDVTTFYLTARNMAFLEIYDQGEWVRVVTAEQSGVTSSGGYTPQRIGPAPIRLALTHTRGQASLLLESSEGAAKRTRINAGRLLTKPQWGVGGRSSWASGPLELGNDTPLEPGEHTLEFRETGGTGGRLEHMIRLSEPPTKP